MKYIKVYLYVCHSSQKKKLSTIFDKFVRAVDPSEQRAPSIKLHSVLQQLGHSSQVPEGLCVIQPRPLLRKHLILDSESKLRILFISLNIGYQY